jgi:hypothetical protein
MNVYIVMGTHIPETGCCLEHLAGREEAEAPVALHVPQGLEWEAAPDAGHTIRAYDPATELWVFDPDAPGTAFILADPRLSPVPQMEKLAGDLAKCLIEPVKILTCVDCAAVEAHHPLKLWYDACIYYSDIVLLGNRSTTSNRFVRDYQKQFERNCYPCLFLLLKGPGKPDDPLEILTPGTRRLSQLFDLPAPGAPPEAAGLLIDASCDLDFEEEEADPFRNPSAEQGPPQHVPDVAEFVVY